MKRKSSPIAFNLFTLILILSHNNQVFGQLDRSFTIGISIPEVLSFGYLDQFSKRWQACLRVGFSPAKTWPFEKDGIMITGSASLYYHFAGKSKFSELPTWFVRMGVSYYVDDQID